MTAQMIDTADGRFDGAFVVGSQAIAEKRAAWVEITGWATGTADVADAEWFEVVEALERKAGRRFNFLTPANVIVYGPDGELAHCGGICRSRDGETVRLSG